MPVRGGLREEQLPRRLRSGRRPDHTNGGEGRDPDKSGACNLSHQKGECPAFDKEYLYCHKKGHFAACCKKKRADNSKAGANPGGAPGDKPEAGKSILKKVHFKKPNAKALAAMDGLEMSAMAMDSNPFAALMKSHGIEYWDSRDSEDSDSVASGITTAFATNSDAGVFQAMYT